MINSTQDSLNARLAPLNFRKSSWNFSRNLSDGTYMYVYIVDQGSSGSLSPILRIFYLCTYRQTSTLLLQNSMNYAFKYKHSTPYTLQKLYKNTCIRYRYRTAVSVKIAFFITSLRLLRPPLVFSLCVCLWFFVYIYMWWGMVHV